MVEILTLVFDSLLPHTLSIDVGRDLSRDEKSVLLRAVVGVGTLLQASRLKAALAFSTLGGSREGVIVFWMSLVVSDYLSDRDRHFHVTEDQSLQRLQILIVSLCFEPALFL
jgi:hypothetical protein